MRILTFDTAGDHGGIGIVETGGPSESAVLSSITAEFHGPGSYGEQILVELDRILKDLHLEPPDIDLVATSVGPGSFTGLRIGIATARGFAFGLGRPLIGIPSLEILAAWAGQVTEMGGSFYAGLIDARRGEVYYAAYRLKTELELEVVVAPGSIEPGGLKEALGPVLGSTATASVGSTATAATEGDRLPLVLCGNGVPVVASELTRWPEPVKTVFPPRGADSALLLARLAAVRHERECAPGVVDALYIRPADARKPGTRL